MFALAATITDAKGWRRRLIALAAGAIGALAMAPFDFFPALAISMTVAVWLIDGSAAKPQRCVEARKSFVLRLALPLATRRAFIIGWWWGFGYFLAGLWWLGAAFLVDADEFAWALPLGVIGLPAVMALYPALGFLLARLIWASGPRRLFALAAALTFTEWLRGHLFTGFPWNTFGMALGGNLVTAQLASIIGLYGLTVVAIVIFSAPALASADVSKAPTFGGRETGRAALTRWAPPICAAVVALAAISGFGLARLSQADHATAAGVFLRIMQPNLALDDKFRPENKAAILAHYLSLSQAAADPALGSADEMVLVWPESAFPFILSRDPRSLAQIGAALPPGAVLITGAARAEESFSAQPAAVDLPLSKLVHPRYFNAIHVISSEGLILDSYDKVHLVPFGEYLPLRSIFELLGLHHFVHVPGGFEAGAARKILALPGLPKFAPLICYEAIFPGEVVPMGASRPDMLLNVTNDGWFGMTAGPHQHFAQARLRAIEEGLPLIRAANTGISAIVDPYGRVLGQLPLGAEGVLDGALPQRIAAPPFARFPFLSAFLVWFAALLTALAGRIRIDNNK
jgi:apolipoprotein N-acyltransferase